MSFVVKAVKSVVKAVVSVVKTVVVGVAGLLIGGLRKKGNAKNKATGNRLSKQLEPEDFRKIIFGKTALAVDLRYWEVHGAKYDRYSEVIAGAGHTIEGFDEFYIEEELVPFSGAAATGKYAGVLSRTTNNGAPGNAALAVGSGSYWNASSKFTGVAHYALAWTVDEKKLPGGVPSRYTQVGRGARVYDPRKDSTRGGVGSHRAEDQSTWAYATVDGNGQPIGRNNALQMLWYLIGWRVQNPVSGEWTLVAGRGVDLNDINWSDFIAAANDAEALQLYTDMILSTGDDHESNEAIISADGLIGELLDPGGLWTYKIVKDDTADVAVVLTDDDVVAGDVEWNPEAPFGDKFNEVAGTYIDPSASSLYQAKAYPTVKDAAYATADGRRKRETHNFQCVQDPQLAQKLARVKLNRTRFTGEFKATFNYRALKAQVWSVVKLSLERYGFVEKLFRVVSQSISANGIEMLLREEHPSIYANGTVTVPAAPSAMAKYDPRLEIPVEGIAAFATTRTGAGSAAEDGLTVSWTAPPGNVRRTEVQFKRTADTAWTAGLTGQSDQTSAYVGPLLPGSQYNVRVRHVSIHEIPGPWSNVNVTTGANGRVTSAQVAYADGTLIEALKPAEAGANVTGTNIAAGITGQAPAATDPTIQTGATNDRGADTRSTDYVPLHYRQNWDRRLRFEFKFVSTVGSPAGADGTYGSMETFAPWQDHSGGPVWQRFTDSAGKRFIRFSAGATPDETWGGWQPEYSGNRRPYFGADLLETSGGAVATLGNFRTSLGTAAAISGQGAFATVSSVGYGSSFLTGFGALAPRSTVLAGSHLRNSADTVFLGDGDIITSSGTAAAISGQAAWATYSGLTPGNVAGQVQFLDTSGNLSALTRVTDRRLTYLRRADGTTDVTEGAIVTSLGTAAAISGQSAWATYGTVSPTTMNVRTSRLLDSDGSYDDVATIRNRRISRLTRDDAVTAITEGMTITSLGTAAAISGQGHLATQNYADWASRVTGVGKPSDNAGTSGILMPIGQYTSVTGNSAIKTNGTHGSYQGGVVGAAQRGGCYVSSSVVTDGATGGGWVTTLALDNTLGNFDPASTRAYVTLTNGTPGSGLCAIYLNAPGVGSQSAASVPVTATSRLMLLYDEVAVYAILDGVVRASVALPAGLTLFPKSLDYFRTEWATPPRVEDIQYGPSRSAARLGSNVFRANGTTAVGDSDAITSLGTAAAISGQGAFATLNSVGFGSGYLTGFGALAAVNAADFATQVTGGAKPEANATADRFVDRRNTNEPPSWYLTNYNTRTAYEFKDAFALGVPGNPGASGYYYGALVTQNDYSDFSGGAIKQRFTYGSGVTAGTTYVRAGSGSSWSAWTKDFNGFLRPAFGDSDLLESGSTVATLGNFRTSLGTSAGIAGQGTLATLNGVNMDSHVSDGSTYARLRASELSSGYHKLTQAGSGVRLGDLRNVPRMLSTNLAYKFTGAITYSASEGSPATATISVGAGSCLIGSTTVSYNAMSANTSGTGGTAVTYWLYVDDASYAGGSQTLIATTNANDIYSNDARVYIGAVTVVYPAAGGGTGGGGGGGGGGYCVAADSVMPCGRTARDLESGDVLTCLDYETLSSTVHKTVESVELVEQACVRVRTTSGAELVASVSTPVTLRDGSYALLVDCLGAELPVQDADGFRWERVEAVRDEGLQAVARIRAGGATYAAGALDGRYVFTHNPEKP